MQSVACQGGGGTAAPFTCPSLGATGDIWVQSERELKQSQVLLLPVSSWSQTSFSLPLAYPDLG